MDKEIALMEREMNLIQYLPPVIQETKEFQVLTETENPKFQKLWKALDGVLKDQFVEDATINGVKRWEKILKINPKDTESIEFRKQRILTKLGETLPYTYKRLKDWLLQVCGGDFFSLELEHELYQLTLRLDYEKVPLLWEITKELRKMVPANLMVQKLVTHETEPAPLYIGNCCTIAVHAVIEPYMAGDYETETILYTCGAVSCGIRGTVGT